MARSRFAGLAARICLCALAVVPGLAACTAADPRDDGTGTTSAIDAGRAHRASDAVRARAGDAPVAGVSPGYSIYSLSQRKLDRLFSEFSRMGLTWVRVDLNWSRVERKPGHFTWSEPDRVITTARKHGLEVLAILGYSPEWANGGAGGGTPPSSAASIAPFAKAAASRYAKLGVATWEIWNEANLAPNWSPQPDPAGYAGLLQAANTAIKAMQPDATVLATGLAAASVVSTEQNMPALDFLSGLYSTGAANSFDGISVHPYTYPGLASTPGSAFQRLQLLRDLMVDQGDGDKLVWVTETGAPTGTGTGAVSQRRQARILVDVLRTSVSYPWIGPILVYGGIDAGTDRSDREDNFGFLKRDFSAKLARSALAREIAAR
jgi:hypothetical protein